MTDTYHQATLQRLIEERDRLTRELKETQLAILAEEGPHHLLGVEVEIKVSWPNGLPRGFDSPDAVRKWARGRLVEMRKKPWTYEEADTP